MCGTLNRSQDAFAACHSKVDFQPYFGQCFSDSCAIGEVATTEVLQFFESKLFSDLMVTRSYKVSNHR